MEKDKEVVIEIGLKKFSISSTCVLSCFLILHAQAYFKQGCPDKPLTITSLLHTKWTVSLFVWLYDFYECSSC
jgi:hypothetical protein